MKEGEDITAAERVNKLVSEAEVTEEISLHSNMVAVNSWVVWSPLSHFKIITSKKENALGTTINWVPTTVKLQGWINAH